MRKVGILPNTSRDKDLSYTKTLIRWLQEKNCQVFVTTRPEETDDTLVPLGAILSTLVDMCQVCEFIIVLGGDGTILEAAPTCAKYSVPLIGINLGSVGYLADAEMNEGIPALQRLLDGEFTTKERMLIETTVNGTTHTALNDICVVKGSTARLITLDVCVNGKYIDTYRADGIIFATPTGSTAYNLAAGGPIVKPDINTIVITPICPYKIFFRPVIVSGDDTITISSPDYSNVLVSIDGKASELSHSIEIKRSSNKVNIIHTTEQNFYDILRKKLSVL